MFHWICPECGREIPPSVRECQICDPKAAAPSVVESPLLAEPVQPSGAAIPGDSQLSTGWSEPAEIAPPEIKAAPPIEPVAQSPEPVPPAVGPPVTQPVVEAAPIVEAAAVIPEPVPTPVAYEPPPVTEPVIEAAPIVEAAAVIPEPVPTPVAYEPPSVTEPVIEAAPIVEASAVVPEPEPTPVAYEPPPVIEPEPIVEAAAEPAPTPVAYEPPPATEPVVEPAPIVEAAAVTPEPAPVAYEPPAVAEPVIEPAPIVEAAAVTPEPAPVAYDPPVVTEPIVEAAAVPEPAPVSEESSAPTLAEPVLETAPVAELAPEAAPTAATLEPAPAPVASDTPIKLHDVPDPLLALAEEIRAAQTARAAALAAPPSSAGLLELAEAVGVEEKSPEAPAPAQVQPVAAPVEPASVTQRFSVAEITTTTLAEATTAVALLAPPEPTPVQEPVAFHELRPTAPAPEPQPFAPPEAAAEPDPPAPPTALAPEPTPPSEGPTLPFAPMQDYKAATSLSIKPVPPPQQILAADSGPRITLPGPTLPPELARLQDANVLTVMGENTAQRTKEAIPPPKKESAPGWMVSVLVMLLLLAAGLGIVFYLLPHTVADAKPAPTPAVAATAPAPTGGTSPLAKYVEVTGFRIVTSSAEANKKDDKKDAPKKSEVQYLVVNHSDADISDANVFVTLRSAKPGQPPICRFSFKVPSLGPFESKEMSSPIEKSRALSLPDWQDLRAEVQISQ